MRKLQLYTSLFLLLLLTNLSSCIQQQKENPPLPPTPLPQYADANEIKQINNVLNTPLLQAPEAKKSKPTLALFNPKKPTPPRFFSADLSMPTKFGTTNNLVKKVGEFYRSYGEVIFVQGTVSDSFGVPIDGAIIEIWQTNAAGKYHTLLEPDSEYIDQYFNMSGRTTTDNLGHYYFITIMPGASPGRAPHINMNIYHPKFGKLETEMYFESHPYNDTDYQYLSYKDDERPLVTANVSNADAISKDENKVCTFNIVMQGTHQFKKF